MRDALERTLREVVPLRSIEGQSKIMPLGQAIQKFVKPGMALHLGLACTPPLAVIYELIRQFRGKDPRFTPFSLGLTTAYTLLVHAGLLQRITTIYLGDSHPSPGLNPVYQKALRKGTLDIRHCSLLTMV